MKTFLLPAVLVLAATFPADGAAQRSRDVPVGSFVERITRMGAAGKEWSVVLLSPTRAQPDTVGRLMWACLGTGELGFGIRRPESAGSYEERQEMISTFDSQPPDTFVLRRLSSSRSWGVPHEDAVELTRRTKSSARLAIRLPGAAGGDATYEYDLSGAGSALDRLECVRSPGPVREARSLPQPPADTTTLPSDEETYEVSAVEELPDLLNRSEFGRLLASSYPPDLRQAGVGGTVVVGFRVRRDGSVDPESITIVSTAHEQLNEPTIRAVSILRWRSARIAGRAVNVWVRLPILWTTGSR